jgi:DNA mismatch repair protein MutS2
MEYFANCMTHEALEQEHRRLVIKMHPDRNPDNPNATAEFQEMQARYEERKAELNGDYTKSARGRERRERERKEREERERKERERARRRKRADGETLRQMEEQEAEAQKMAAFRTEPLKVGEKVRIKDNGMVGEVAKVSTKAVSVVVGSITTKLPLDRVERITANEYKAVAKTVDNRPRQVYDTAMTERKARFKLELDVRGERVNDALEIVMRYIDDAIMLGVPSVRILHGKGTGALREEIQKYVRTVPGVQSVADEHVQFGGSGVTVVKFD